MTNECLVAVFDSVPKAEQAVHILDRAGFGSDRVSLVMRHIEPDSELAQELNWGDDSLRNAAVGAALGGLAGIFSDAAIFLMTGVGVVVVAGPLVAAMGVVVGALLGVLEGWGVHRSHIRRYERLVQHGNVLVVVGAAPGELAKAHHLLEEMEVVDLKLFAESSEDSPEIDDRRDAAQHQRTPSKTEHGS